MKLLTTILLLSFSFLSLSQQKHALVVAVSDYPIIENSRPWSDLSSDKDVELIMNMLKAQHFPEQNIILIQDKQSTPANVMNALDEVILKLDKGDIFYFHYSGHGQQVEDCDPKNYPNLRHAVKDEPDGYDEALALYNSPIDWYEGYDFSEHLIDDQLDYYLTKIESVLGEKGHMVITLDACHSGTATRGTAPSKKRGSSDKCKSKGYRPPRRDFKYEDKNFVDVPANSTYGVKAVFMGCQNDQINYETEVNDTSYGSLTYAFVAAISSLKTKASYGNISRLIEARITSEDNEGQIPEFLLDAPKVSIFGGDIVTQPEFIQIITRTESIGDHPVYSIQSGHIQNIKKGDSISFYHQRITEINKDSVLFEGIVSHVSANSSLVKCGVGSPRITSKEILFYKGFRHYENQPAQILNLSLKIEDKTLRKQLQKIIKDNENYSLKKEDDNGIDYYLKENQDGHIFIEIPFSGYKFRNMDPLDISDMDNLDSLTLYLDQALRIDCFRKLRLNDPEIEIEVEFEKVSDSVKEKYIDDRLNDPDPKVKKAWEKLKDKNIVGLNINVQNNSYEDLYVYAVVIQPNREIQVLKMGQTNDIKDYIKIPRGLDDFLFRGKRSNPTRWFTCDGGIDCGMENMYIYASVDKINFDVIKRTGKSIGKRGSGDSDFVKLIKDGASGQDGSVDSVSGVKLLKFKYELKP